MADKTKLELRRAMKKKKPVFLRQDAHKIKRVGQKWRKPKGGDSKMRFQFKGYRALVKPGYGSPADVKGLTRDGFVPVKVSNIDELANLKKETDGVVVCGRVGAKKRIDILKKCAELGLTVVNFKDPKDYVQKKEEEILKKKDAKKKKSEERAKKKKEKEKEKDKKEKKDLADKVEKFDDKEKKDIEKQEKDKLLTKKAN